MMKLLTVLTMFLFFCTSFAMQSLDLITKLDKGLPPSGRNGSGLGEIVSYVGDVNNDGYDDWAIGLPYAATYETGIRKGKVYIYYGGSSIPSNDAPDLIISGEKERDSFGQTVKPAGDVNNDGYSDVLVMCSRYVAIYYGGNPVDSVADVIFEKEDRSGYFGVDLSSAGDINNDGYDDVLIGSKDSANVYYF